MGNSQANVVKTGLPYRDSRVCCSYKNKIDDKVLFVNRVSFLGQNRSANLRKAQLRFCTKASVQSQPLPSDRDSGPLSSARPKSVIFFFFSLLFIKIKKKIILVILCRA